MFPNYPYQAPNPPPNPPQQPLNPYLQPPYMNAAARHVTRPDLNKLMTPQTLEGKADRERLLATMHLLPPMPNAIYTPAASDMFGLVKGKTPEQIAEKRRQEMLQMGKDKKTVIPPPTGQQQVMGQVYPTGGPLAPLPRATQDLSKPWTLPRDYYTYRDKGV